MHHSHPSELENHGTSALKLHSFELHKLVHFMKFPPPGISLYSRKANTAATILLHGRAEGELTGGAPLASSSPSDSCILWLPRPGHIIASQRPGWVSDGRVAGWKRALPLHQPPLLVTRWATSTVWLSEFLMNKVVRLDWGTTAILVYHQKGHFTLSY